MDQRRKQYLKLIGVTQYQLKPETKLFKLSDYSTKIQSDLNVCLDAFNLSKTEFLDHSSQLRLPDNGESELSPHSKKALWNWIVKNYKL